MKKILKFLLIIFSFCSIAYFVFLIFERNSAKIYGKYVSNDNLFSAEIYIVREPVLDFDYLYLVKIYDSKRNLLKSASAYNSYIGNVFWSCPNNKCDKFVWGYGDEHIIDLPPSWFDGVKALIP